MTFIDAFVAAVPDENREAYRRHCEIADPWFLENGALRVIETWGEDVPKGEVTDLYRAVAAKDGETVVCGFIEWPDKETRDKAMGLMMSADMVDERFDPEKNPMPFDGKRMIFGGFTTIFEQAS